MLLLKLIQMQHILVEKQTEENEAYSVFLLLFVSLCDYGLIVSLAAH